MDATILRDERVERYMAEAKEDLVGLWEIARDARERAAADGNVMDDALAIVRELLARGLMAGDPPYSAGGYHAWADQEPDRVVARIRREWQALGRIPDIPDIAWFARAR